MSQLTRELGLPGAVITGLGSILGTGVFVSLAIAAGWTFEYLWVAVLAAGVLATFNGMSSAQLAAAHPVSGGTYEYGTVFVHPAAGLAAGWLFLVAKSASAATAALGASAYLLHVVGADPARRVPVALGIGVALVLVVLGGVRRTTIVNGTILTVTLGGLATYIAGGFAQPGGWSGFSGEQVAADAFLTATALVFVAFTGYGRIATMGEEVRDPAITIPRAVIVTLAASALLYVGVAWVSTRTFAGMMTFTASLDGDAAPLEAVARAWEQPVVAVVVAVAAVAAMLGVLLNLVLGLSRVVLAMGRRHHLPPLLGTLTRGQPRAAVVAVGVLILGLVLIGDVRTTWSISAVTVLLYYGITNLAALRLPSESRRFWRWLPWAGLAGCAGLAFFVDLQAWLAGLGVVLMGIAVSYAFQRRRISD